MTTREERFAIAAKLREKHYEQQGMFVPQSLSMQALNTVEALLDCIPVKRALLLDLADLIEHEHVLKMTPGGLCPECRRLIGHRESYCGWCGARVVE